MSLFFSLSACGSSFESEQQPGTAGGKNPVDAVSTFFRELNSALQDPDIVNRDVRQAWTGRLASYFAPSERIIQRDAMGTMLANFAEGLNQLEDDQQIIVEILYSSIDLVEAHDDRATVRILDGWLRMRHVQVLPGGNQRVISDQRQPLSEIIGSRTEEFPVLRVNGRWFITER